MTPDDWNDGGRRCVGALLSGDTGDRFISLQGYRELDDSFLAIVNGHDSPIEFTLPSTPAVAEWIEQFDTARWAGSPTNAAFSSGTAFTVADRSLVLFAGGARP
jgi:glycogen operon protein